VPAGAGVVPLAAEGDQVGADGAGRDIKPAGQVGDGGESACRFGFGDEAQETMAAQGHLALPRGEGGVSLAGVYRPGDGDGLGGGRPAVGGCAGVGQADAQTARRG